MTRLVEHLELAALQSDPDPAIGADNLATLMSASEALTFDLGAMTEVVERETERLTRMLAAACAQIDPAATPREVIRRLLADRPRSDSEILANAQTVTNELLQFTAERSLVPYLDGEMEFGLDHEAQGLFFANMRFCAPEEPNSPSTYHVTPPDWSWPQPEIDEWLETFSPTLIGSMCAHEAAPGHFAHARALRRVGGLPQRILMSYTFAGGWAHYAEERCLEEGFRADDPRYEIGVCIRALARVARLASAIGPQRNDDGAGQHRPIHRRCFLPTSGGRAGGQPRPVRPDVSQVHLGQTGDPGLPRASPRCLGAAVLARPVPRGDFRARITADRVARQDLRSDTDRRGEKPVTRLSFEAPRQRTPPPG